MTTQNCINELRSSISSHPQIKSIEITQEHDVILHFNNDTQDKHFSKGLDVLEWIEENLTE